MKNGKTVFRHILTVILFILAVAAAEKAVFASDSREEIRNIINDIKEKLKTVEAASAPEGITSTEPPAKLTDTWKDSTEEARKIFRELRQSVKTKIKKTFLLADANISIMRGNLTRAVSSANDILAIDPENEGAKSVLSRVEDIKNKPEEERLLFPKSRSEKKEEKKKKLTTKETAFNKDVAGAYIGRAKRCMDTTRYDKARRYANKARSLDPENPAIPPLIAEIEEGIEFADRNKYEKEMIRKAEKTPENPELDIIEKHPEPKGFILRFKDTFKSRFEMEPDIERSVYTVDRCVQIALEKSHRLVTAERQIKMAELRLWEARRELFPQLAVKGELSSGRIGADNLVRHWRGKKYNFEVKQTIFDGMEKWFAVDQAKTNVEILKLERQKIINEVTDETKKAYYNLDKAVKANNVQESLRTKVDNWYKITGSAYEQEIMPKVEFLKVKGQKLQADFRCMSSEEDVSLARMMLYQTMDMEPDREINIQEVKIPENTLSLGLANCYSLALAHEPELKIKEKTIDYYNYERKMKKAKGWPRFDFTGSFGSAYENYEPLSLAADYQDVAGSSRAGRRMEPEWYIGLKTTLPIWGSTLEHNYVREVWAPTVSSFRGTQSATNYFTLRLLDNLEYYSSVEETRVGFERSLYEYDKARDDLMVKVKEGYFKYRKSVLQLDIANAQIEHQSTYVAIMEERQKMGEMEISRVIEELEKLGEYEFGLVQSVADYYIALSELNRNIGIPDYFKPDYEDKEFQEWRKKFIAKY